MEEIAILASGKGSNADRLCVHFNRHASARIRLIVCDREDAGVFEVARKHHVPAVYLSPSIRKEPGALLKILREHGISFVILAGYLRLIPADVIAAFPRRIINLHPSLLPKFGGKGMFGMHVHEAVFAAGEKETGITIHYVDENYDEGDIIEQFRTGLDPGDDPAGIALKIAQLEALHFASTAEAVVLKAARANG